MSRPDDGMSDIVTVWRGDVRLTIRCAVDDCGTCHGYIAPLTFGTDRPCGHGCHGPDGAGNPRDYMRSVESSRLAPP